LGAASTTSSAGYPRVVVARGDDAQGVLTDVNRVAFPETQGFNSDAPRAISFFAPGLACVMAFVDKAAEEVQAVVAVCPCC
jgi:hypothetical protein